MAKGKPKKESCVEEQNTAPKEQELNVTQAALYFKVSETSRAIMLKKFKNDSMVKTKWESLLSKHKINF